MAEHRETYDPRSVTWDVPAQVVPGEPIIETARRLDALNKLPSSAERQFQTGATRDTDRGKFDYEGFLSPLVLEAFGRYMHICRETPTGTRASDNWQQGIPIDVYMKSKWRHFFDTWKAHRGFDTKEAQPVNLLAELFNTMGMLHETLKAMTPHDIEVAFLTFAHHREEENRARARAATPPLRP